MNRRTTYTYKWPGRKKPNGLAINCHMKNGQLRYFDTIRGHMISGEIVEDGEDAFKLGVLEELAETDRRGHSSPACLSIACCPPVRSTKVSMANKMQYHFPNIIKLCN